MSAWASFRRISVPLNIENSPQNTRGYIDIFFTVYRCLSVRSAVKTSMIPSMHLVTSLATHVISCLLYSLVTWSRSSLATDLSLFRYVDVSRVYRLTPHVGMHSVYRVAPKIRTIFCTPYLPQTLIDFRNYFTVRIRRKFVIILSLKIAPF